MSGVQGIPGEDKSSSLDRSGVRSIVVVILQVAVTGVLLFVCAGRLDWILGWVYIGLSIFVLVFNGPFLLRRHPEVINERGEVTCGQVTLTRNSLSLDGRGRG